MGKAINKAVSVGARLACVCLLARVARPRADPAGPVTTGFPYSAGGHGVPSLRSPSPPLLHHPGEITKRRGVGLPPLPDSSRRHLLALPPAEILKRRVAGLHQTVDISTVSIAESWDPLEEGLQRIETSRQVSMIAITLSLTPLDSAHIGYQVGPRDRRIRILRRCSCERGLASCVR